METAELAEWQEKYRVAVQPQVSEPVESAWVFYRSGGFASMGVAKVSPIVAMGMRAINKRKAGGLPNSFVLAVTPKHVHAFEYKARARGATVTVGKELAVWDREGLVVTSKPAAINTQVTLESPGEGETVVCSTGKDEASLAMIRSLQTPVAA